MSNMWLGDQIPIIRSGNVDVWPYLIGDCAFALYMLMMKTLPEEKRRKYPMQFQ